MLYISHHERTLGHARAAIHIFNLNYMTPSSRNFTCHFQALARTSFNGVSAFQPSTLLALVQSPQIFSISPSLRGPNFQFSFTPVASSKVSTISLVVFPCPVPILKYSILSVSSSNTRRIAATCAFAKSTT